MANHLENNDNNIESSESVKSTVCVDHKIDEIGQNGQMEVAQLIKEQDTHII